jgi:hypothetical protein
MAPHATFASPPSVVHDDLSSAKEVVASTAARSLSADWNGQWRLKEGSPMAHVMIWQRADQAPSLGGHGVSETNDATTGADEFDLVEVEIDDVDEAGNVVVDDVVAMLDSTGNIIVTDETITKLTADGDLVVDETLSVVGYDGELHAVEEDVTVLTAADRTATRTPAKKAVKRTPAKKAVKRTPAKKAVKRTPAKKAVKRRARS